MIFGGKERRGRSTSFDRLLNFYTQEHDADELIVFRVNVAAEVLTRGGMMRMRNDLDVAPADHSRILFGAAVLDAHAVEDKNDPRVRELAELLLRDYNRNWDSVIFRRDVEYFEDAIWDLSIAANFSSG